MENEKLAKTIYESLEKIRGKIPPSRFKDIAFPLFFLLFASKKFNFFYEKEKKALEESNKSGGQFFERQIFDPKVILTPKFFIEREILYVPEDASWQAIITAYQQNRLYSQIKNSFKVLKEVNKELQTDFLVDEINPSDFDGGGAKNLESIARLFTEKLWENNEIFQNPEDIEDTFGQIYEYMINRYGDQSNAKAGEFYTPASVIDLLVNFLDVQPGKNIYDPCCGSGGMFLRALNYIKKNHKDKFDPFAIKNKFGKFYGQEINKNTISICWSGLIINGIKPHLGQDDTFVYYYHHDVVGKIDYVLANPPFNLSLDKDKHSKWDSDKRWVISVPSLKNANMAWIEHIYYFLRNDGGKAAVILSNDSASSPDSLDVNSRRKLLENGCVRAILFLPENLFINTSISVCVWFIEKNKDVKNTKTLILSYQEGGETTSRNTSKLTPTEIQKLKELYNSYLDNKLEDEGSAVIYKNYECRWKILNNKEFLAENKECVLTPGTFNLEDDIDLNEELMIDEIPFEPGKEDEVVLKEAEEIHDYLKDLSISKNNYQDFETLFFGKLATANIFLNTSDDPGVQYDRQELNKILQWSKKRKVKPYSSDEAEERTKKKEEFLEIIKDPLEISNYQEFIETDENKEFLDFLKENEFCFDYNFDEESDHLEENNENLENEQDLTNN